MGGGSLILVVASLLVTEPLPGAAVDPGLKPRYPVSPGNQTASMATNKSDLEVIHSCLQGLLWQESTGVCCVPYFHCPPGYEIRACTEPGGEDQCVPCKPGMGQTNNVSSLNMEEAVCFTLENADECPLKDTKPSRKMPDVLSCVMFCECRNEACWYGVDSCRCNIRKHPCPPGYQMNRTTGECEPCPWFSYKNYQGCDPCTINATLWSRGYPDPTTPRMINIIQSSATTPAAEERNGSDPVVVSDQVQVGASGEEDKPSNSTILYIIIVAVTVIVLVVAIVFFLYCRYTRNHAVISESLNTTVLPTQNGHMNGCLPNGHTTCINLDTQNGGVPNGILLHHNKVISNGSNGISPNGKLPNGRHVVDHNLNRGLPNGNVQAARLLPGDQEHHDGSVAIDNHQKQSSIIVSAHSRSPGFPNAAVSNDGGCSGPPQGSGDDGQGSMMVSNDLSGRRHGNPQTSSSTSGSKMANGNGDSGYISSRDTASLSQRNGETVLKSNNNAETENQIQGQGYWVGQRSRVGKMDRRNIVTEADDADKPLLSSEDNQCVEIGENCEADSCCCHDNNTHDDHCAGSHGRTVPAEEWRRRCGLPTADVPRGGQNPGTTHITISGNTFINSSVNVYPGAVEKTDVGPVSSEPGSVPVSVSPAGQNNSVSNKGAGDNKSNLGRKHTAGTRADCRPLNVNLSCGGEGDTDSVDTGSPPSSDSSFYAGQGCRPEVEVGTRRGSPRSVDEISLATTSGEKTVSETSDILANRSGMGMAATKQLNSGIALSIRESVLECKGAASSLAKDSEDVNVNSGGQKLSRNKNLGIGADVGDRCHSLGTLEEGKESLETNKREVNKEMNMVSQGTETTASLDMVSFPSDPRGDPKGSKASSNGEQKPVTGTEVTKGQEKEKPVGVAKPMIRQQSHPQSSSSRPELHRGFSQPAATFYHQGAAPSSLGNQTESSLRSDEYLMVQIDGDLSVRDFAGLESNISDESGCFDSGSTRDSHQGSFRGNHGDVAMATEEHRTRTDSEETEVKVVDGYDSDTEPKVLQEPESVAEQQMNNLKDLNESDDSALSGSSNTPTGYHSSRVAEQQMLRLKELQNADRESLKPVCGELSDRHKGSAGYKALGSEVNGNRDAGRMDELKCDAVSVPDDHVSNVSDRYRNSTGLQALAPVSSTGWSSSDSVTQSDSRAPEGDSSLRYSAAEKHSEFQGLGYSVNETDRGGNCDETVVGRGGNCEVTVVERQEGELERNDSIELTPEEIESVLSGS